MDPIPKQEINNIEDERSGDKITAEKLPKHVNSYFINIGTNLANKFTTRKNSYHP